MKNFAAFLPLLVAVSFFSACNDPVVPPVVKFAIGGKVSGLTGTGLVLQNNAGDDLTVSANGTFTFATKVANGGAYAVTVKTRPTCHTQSCVVAHGTGKASAAVTGVTVTCTELKTRFFSTNWGDKSARVTDDIGSLADGATATPRIIVGSNTTFAGLSNRQNVAYDPANDRLYVADQTSVKVFNGASTATGNIAPDRTFTVNTATYLTGVALDLARDRIYVGGGDGGGGNTYIFNNASTQTGTVTADAVVAGLAWMVFLEPTKDILYTTDLFGGLIFVFDNAHTLTTGATPSRTITLTAWNNPAAKNVSGVWLDVCTNRLYVAVRNYTVAGNNLFAFPNGATLSGSVDMDADSVMRFPLDSAMAVVVDGNDTLYTLPDSATAVRLYLNIGTKTGTLTGTPDKTINGVVNKSDSIAVESY